MRILAERLAPAESGIGSVVLLQIVLLIGAAEFPLADVHAVRLERTIRRRCVDERRLPFDDEARACLQLADVLAEDLAAGTSPEPIQLGRRQLDGLWGYLLENDEPVGVEEVTDLRDAIKRYRDEDR